MHRAIVNSLAVLLCVAALVVIWAGITYVGSMKRAEVRQSDIDNLAKFNSLEKRVYLVYRSHDFDPDTASRKVKVITSGDKSEELIRLLNSETAKAEKPDHWRALLDSIEEILDAIRNRLGV